jgi:hypothetical protein
MLHKVKKMTLELNQLTDRIISIRGEVWARKMSLNRYFCFIEMLGPRLKSERPVCVC